MDSLILRSKTVRRKLSDKTQLAEQVKQVSPLLPEIDENKELTVKMGTKDDITEMVKYHKFEWLVGSVYMNCEGVRKEENILKFEYIKVVVWRALDDGLGIMIGGDINVHIWELDGCENENGRRMKENMNEIGLQILNCV